MIRKMGMKEHHLWKKRDSAGSGHKALNLVRIVCVVFFSLFLNGFSLTF